MAGAGARQLLEQTGLRSVKELAETDGVRDCLLWFAREKRWIDEKHLAICRIPAPTFQEEERAAWMVKQFRELGYETELDRAGNVIARSGDTSYPPIALTAHLDTVLAPRRPDDISVGGDGKFHGPGVSDNGAGLAALLAVAGALARLETEVRTSLPALFIANVGEEGEGNLSGMRYLCRHSGVADQVRAFLVIDGPAVDRITYRAVASRRFEISMAGPGGHSWSDYGIGNPVHAISRAITLFSEHRVNGAPGQRTSYNVGMVEGGASINSIPTSASAKVDLRSEDTPRIEELATLLTSAVEKALETENSASVGAKLSAKIREIGFRPGGQLPEDSPLLQCLRAVDTHLGIRAHLDCASTDANVPLSMGLPAISIGAGGEGGGAHTPSEWYHPRGREIGLRRIFLALALLSRLPAVAPVSSR